MHDKTVWNRAPFPGFLTSPKGATVYEVLSPKPWYCLWVLSFSPPTHIQPIGTSCWHGGQTQSNCSPPSTSLLYYHWGPCWHCNGLSSAFSPPIPIHLQYIHKAARPWNKVQIPHYDLKGPERFDSYWGCCVLWPRFPSSTERLTLPAVEGAAAK